MKMKTDNGKSADDSVQGEKPDFFEVVKGKFIHSGKAAHSRIPIQSVNERESRAYVAGCNYVWDEYIKPLQSRIAELEAKSSPLEKREKSAEEILDEWVIWNFEIEQCVDKIFFIKAMEEYAEQFKTTHK